MKQQLAAMTQPHTVKPQKSPVSAVEAGLFGWGREMKWRCVPRSRLWREFFVGKMLFEERLVLFFKPGLGHVVRTAFFPATVFFRRSELLKETVVCFVRTRWEVFCTAMNTIGTLSIRRDSPKPLAVINEPVVFNVCQKLFE